MVQIIPADPSQTIYGDIGKAFGQSLSQRAMTEFGLRQAENAANAAEGDPVKLAFALARASSYAPQINRSLGQMYEQLLLRTQGQQLSEGLPQKDEDPNTKIGPESINSPMAGANPDIDGEIAPRGVIAPSTDTPSNASAAEARQADSTPIIYPPNKNKYNADDIESISSQFLMDVRPDLVEGSSQYGRVPTFNYEAKSTLRPEEEQQIRQSLINRKMSPQVIDRVVETTRKDVEAKYNEYLKNFSMDQDRQKQVREKWSTFKNESDKNLEPILGQYSPYNVFGGKFGGRPKTYEDLKNKYFQYAGNLPVDLTPEQMHAQASALLQNDKKRVDALAGADPVPYIRDPKDMEDYLNSNKDSYKNLYKEGFYQTLVEDSAEKDMGLEELHWSIWGDDTSRESLNTLASVKAPQKFMGGTTDLRKINPKYTKEKKAYVDSLAKKISKIKPDDDLVLLRAQVLNNGGYQEDFTEAIKMSEEKYGFNLSPFQKSQWEELNIPRKRAMWQIFSPRAWGSWVNNMRGKR